MVKECNAVRTVLYSSTQAPLTLNKEFVSATLSSDHRPPRRPFELRLSIHLASIDLNMILGLNAQAPLGAAALTTDRA